MRSEKGVVIDKDGYLTFMHQFQNKNPRSCLASRWLDGASKGNGSE
jgi:hypothetical protein